MPSINILAPGPQLKPQPVVGSPLVLYACVTHHLYRSERLLSRQMGAVVHCEDGGVYKHGRRVKCNEFDAMKLVAEHTNVPVPRSLQYEQLGNMGMIVMSFIPGTPLSDMWKEMPSHNRQSVLTQLRGYVAEWRKISQPVQCNRAFVMGGAVSDKVPIPGREFTGPFLDDATFR
jgi:hypothetical protein